MRRRAASSTAVGPTRLRRASALLRRGLLLNRRRRRWDVGVRQLLGHRLLYGRLPRARRLLAEEGVPLLLRAVEDVAIDVAVDPGRLAVRLILPERPGARSVLDRGMVLGGPDPDRIVGEGAARQDRLVEVHRRVDDRPLAVVALHFLQHHLHVGCGAFLGEMAMAGLRGRRGLDVEHRRQGVVLDRRVLLEKGHLLHRRAAPIDEMIGAVRHARGFCAGPIGLEALVGAIAALGRLDPGELDAAAGDCVPIDVALELGDVDPVDRIVMRLGKAGLNHACRKVGDINGPRAAAATRQQQPRAQGRGRRRSGK